MELENITTFDLRELSKFKKIFVLVSGGFDSTYLYEKIKSLHPFKTIPVNCFNPYEYNKTLKTIEKSDKKFIRVNPKNYKDVIKESFLKIPKAMELKKVKKYHKKIFRCCYVLKHKLFLKDNRFKEDGTVVISGIKKGDGTQRRIWLTQLGKGTEPCNQSNGKPTFYHKHKTGQLYCYPFRDFTKRNLSEEIKEKLFVKYPFMKHSGCILCPVLVVFNLISEGERYEKSMSYARNLGVIPKEKQKKLKDF